MYCGIKLWKNAEGSIDRIVDRVAELSRPIGGWIETLDKAQAAQGQLNAAVAATREQIEKMSVLFDKDGRFFADFAERLADNGLKLNNEITRLIASISDLKGFHALSSNALEASSADLKFIREYQEILEKSVNGFEITLQQITSNMGGAFSQTVNYNMKETLRGLADETRENINSITKANFEIIEKIERLFDSLAEQSKAQSAAIINLTEAMGETR